MSGYDEMYEGTPPWEIGRAQRAVIELADKGAFHGRVLDVGCGTGDNAIFLASRGLEVVGIDLAGIAIDKAKEKSHGLDRAPRFLVADALELARLNTTFDTVLDCGFFHTLTDEGRVAYLQSLQRVMPPGAVLHILCFSDDEPAWGGPRRVTKKELEELGFGFFPDDIAAIRFENRLVETGAAAFRASYTFGGRGPEGLQ